MDLNIKVRCECSDWEKNIESVVSAMVHMNIFHDIKYNGEVMRYCPWCGQQIIKEIKK